MRIELIGQEDEGLAVQQAKELHNAGIGKRFGTDEKTFTRILTQSSRAQIRVSHRIAGGFIPLPEE